MVIGEPGPLILRGHCPLILNLSCLMEVEGRFVIIDIKSVTMRELIHEQLLLVNFNL